MMKKNILLHIGGTKNKKELVELLRSLDQKQYEFYATRKTHIYLLNENVDSYLVYSLSKPVRTPNIRSLLQDRFFDVVLNIPTGSVAQKTAKTTQTAKKENSLYSDSAYIGSESIKNHVLYSDNLENAKSILEKLAENKLGFKKLQNEKPEYQHLLSGQREEHLAYMPYRTDKSYDWNYEFGPIFKGELPVREKFLKKRFMGFDVNSLFGVPAGPLLNAKWISLYAKLGFDILTYKTVRTKNFPCHSLPNVLFCEMKDYRKKDIPKGTVGRPYAGRSKFLTITNSYGVPSKDPDVWQGDVQKAQDSLSDGQLLIVSVMGTPNEQRNEKAFIKDHAVCASLAVEAGAKVVEVNLSCPNLASEGIICFDTKTSAEICEEIKNTIGNVPLIAKISAYESSSQLKKFVHATHEFLDGYCAINTVQGVVDDRQVKKATMRNLGVSGFCGSYITKHGLSMVERLSELRKQWGLNYSIIGVGGVTTPQDYETYLQLGADAVQAATGAWLNPYLAHEVYKSEIKIAKTYTSAKKFGDLYFESKKDEFEVSDLTKMYMDMVYPENDEVRTLQIEKTPFKLKHGEPGRKESSIYLNHRHVIYSDKWDRRLLAEVLYYGISEHLLGGEKDYGVVAIESTSSPELTSILLDYFPGIKRAVIVPEQMRKQEKNHRRVYGDLEGARNWILIDDVFTSGKTMRQAIDVLADEGLGKGQVFSLVHRDDEAAENFKHGVGYDFGSLTSLDQILSHHWGKLGKLKRDLVKKERMHFI